MSEIKLGTGGASISGSGANLVSASPINFGGNWIDAPPGTVITSNSAALASSFSTTNDNNTDTGHACAIVRKLDGGSTSGTSKCFVYLMGGCRNSNNANSQAVSVLYRKINSGSDSELRYMDASYGAGTESAWTPHSAFYEDASASSGSAGDTITYKMYTRSRGGSHTVAYHEVIGGVSHDVWLVVQEVVN